MKTGAEVLAEMVKLGYRIKKLPVYRVLYQDNPYNRQWKKTSLSMNDYNACMKNAQLLKQQERWFAIKVKREV